MQEKQTIAVWDLPVRVFHWSLLALVVLAFVTAETKGWLFQIHLYAGYGVIGLVAFRLAWGVVGTRYARFREFVRPWPAVRAHAVEVLGFSPARFIGHNPLGGWMIVALLATLALLTVTGLFAGDEGKHGPDAHLIAAWLAHGLKEAHEGLNTLLWTLVAVHVAGVAVESLLTGENLVRAIWTGRKDAVPGDAGKAVAAGPVRAVPLTLSLGLAAAAVWTVIG
jgi:cytochrome b